MRGIRLRGPASPTPTTRGHGIRIPRSTPAPSSAFFHLHAHSRFSLNDALPPVKEMVATVAAYGQPALALTDHGNMGGAVQLYTECRKAGILPFPGIEAYFVTEHPKGKRYHLGLVATSTAGYEALVRLSSRSFTRERFWHKPLIDWVDLAEWYERGWTQGLALTTGCYFGLTIQTLVNEGSGAAKHVLQRFASFVPRTLVEVQNHNISHDGQWSDLAISEALVEAAEELGLPVVVTQDAHYCDPAHKSIHETLKRVVAFGPDPEDAVFPGDGFHLCDANWVRERHTDKVWQISERTLADLVDSHQLAIAELDRYHYAIPKIVERPEEVLRDRCLQVLGERHLAGHYRDRLGEELDVITDTGMSNYMLLVAAVTDWMREVGIFFQTRGSACGSLVAWLLGITAVDPLKYRLRFERFMSRDRTKPPDIDLDVEQDRRVEVIEWMKTKFSVLHIGAYSQFGIEHQEGHEREGRGSLIVAYKKIARARGENVDHILGLADIPEADRVNLQTLATHAPLKSYHPHPAGFVVTLGNAIERLVPTMLVASSDATISQFYDDDIEALGLVKLDVLGLRTLSLLRRAVELLGRDPRDGLDWIPLDDTRTFTTVRHGATDGVFQLEGGTAQRGCREIKVRSLKDIIVVMALYRTAVMASGMKDTYIARREGRQPVPERHQIIHKHTQETFGLPIFQDQVVGVLRDLGMSPEDLTDLLKAVKASQKAEIATARAKIEGFQHTVSRLATLAGMTDEDFAFIWSAIEGFAEYGFNRAHATMYGITAYRCAFLRTHCPLEFATALLETSAGTAKEDRYVEAVRRMNIRIMRPHVNISGTTYSIDRNRKAIRKGLLSIKGIGDKVAAELAANAPYDSIEDLIKRCNPRAVNGGKAWPTERTLNGHLEKLRVAGALEDLIAP